MRQRANVGRQIELLRLTHDIRPSMSVLVSE